MNKNKTYTLYTMCKNCGNKKVYKVEYGIDLSFCQCLNCGSFRLEYLDEVPLTKDIKNAILVNIIKCQ